MIFLLHYTFHINLIKWKTLSAHAKFVTLVSVLHKTSMEKKNNLIVHQIYTISDLVTFPANSNKLEKQHIIKQSLHL